MIPSTETFFTLMQNESYMLCTKEETTKTHSCLRRYRLNLTISTSVFIRFILIFALQTSSFTTFVRNVLLSCSRSTHTYCFFQLRPLLSSPTFQWPSWSATTSLSEVPIKPAKVIFRTSTMISHFKSLQRQFAASLNQKVFYPLFLCMLYCLVLNTCMISPAVLVSTRRHASKSDWQNDERLCERPSTVRIDRSKWPWCFRHSFHAYWQPWFCVPP